MPNELPSSLLHVRIRRLSRNEREVSKYTTLLNLPHLLYVVRLTWVTLTVILEQLNRLLSLLGTGIESAPSDVSLRAEPKVVFVVALHSSIQTHLYDFLLS